MSKGVIKPLTFEASGLSRSEWRILKSLSSPKKIQDFVNKLQFNFEKKGETHRSVREVLKHREAHCFEGALLAAAALWIAGRRPLILDLKTVRPDFDHVVALFEEDGEWGAISKTNHTVLRYREPIYRNVRELSLSYFHEYFLPNGKKTLRSYSAPFDLSKAPLEWLSDEENLAYLAHILDQSKHFSIISSKKVKQLRLADKVERKSGEIVEYDN